MQVHAAVLEQDQLHVGTVADDLAGPVIYRENGGHDADFLFFRHGGQAAGTQQGKGKQKCNCLFHIILLKIG